MKILNRLPFSQQERVVPLPNGNYQTIQPLLVVVWVSLKIREQQYGPIPAFLDSGHNHNFSISRDQFRSWLGIEPESLEPSGRVRLRGAEETLRKADILLHRNQPGTELLIADNPLSLGTDQDRGIAIHEKTPWKLPLLGMRPIVRNNLHLTINGRHGHVTLRTARFWE
jgi:hypothetical protein